MIYHLANGFGTQAVIRLLAMKCHIYHPEYEIIEETRSIRRMEKRLRLNDWDFSDLGARSWSKDYVKEWLERQIDDPNKLRSLTTFGADELAVLSKFLL